MISGLYVAAFRKYSTNKTDIKLPEKVAREISGYHGEKVNSPAAETAGFKVY